MIKKLIVFLFFIITLSSIGQLPPFQWAKQFGGSNLNIGNGIIYDALGNVYTTGLFYGVTDFNPGPSVYNLTANGLNADVFVSKLDANGNFVWAKSLGGVDDDFGNSIIVDHSGNVYSTGFFQDTVDFDPGAGTFTLSSRGDKDIFILKLDASGNFVWAKSIGDTLFDTSNSIALDLAGNIYTTGQFAGTVDFNPGVGNYAMSTLSNNQWDIFASKLDSLGNFIWAKQMGGALFSTNFGNSITVDESYNIYTTGGFQGTGDFDPSPSTFTLNTGGVTDAFILKLDSLGHFVWAKNLRGPNFGFGYSIAVGKFGNIYSTGYFQNTVDCDPGPSVYTFTSIGLEDIYISKLNSQGNFVWAKQIGGPNPDFGRCISLDTLENVYSTGYFEGTVDFNPGTGTFPLTSFGMDDIYISKLDSGGNFVWSINMGEAGTDVGYSIAIDKSSNIFTTGWFGGTVDFDPGPSTYTLTGGADVFVHKMGKSSVGVKENEFSQIKLLYPNPSSGIFYLCGLENQSQIEVYDLTGRQILKVITKDKISSVDLTNYDNGIYFYKIIGEGIYSGKLVKH